MGGAGMGGAGGAGMGGAGSGGTGGEVCSGCARLSVPVDEATDRAHYVLTLPGVTDFTSAMFTVRVRRYAATGGSIRMYVQHGGDPDFLYVQNAFTALSGVGTSFQNVTWDVSTVTGTFDRTVIYRVGIEITANDGSTAWTDPTVVHVDSVTITGTTPTLSAWTFDAASSVNTTPTENGSAGSMWLNSYSADTTATGAAISWLGP
jgi:hypothetical protein